MRSCTNSRSVPVAVFLFLASLLPCSLGEPLHWKSMTGNLFENTADGGAAGAGKWFTAHCDGGSRGNPGPSGYGAVIEDAQDQVVARLSEFLGHQTNNYAEYKGLLAVLTWALANGVGRLRVFSDSELMVRK